MRWRGLQVSGQTLAILAEYRDTNALDVVHTLDRAATSQNADGYRGVYTLRGRLYIDRAKVAQGMIEMSYLGACEPRK
jgi:hypothetical protein